MKESRPFLELAECLELVRATGSKNRKVELVSDYLRRLSPQDAELAARIATGRASERGSRDEVQTGYSTLVGILKDICEVDDREVSRVYRKHGDLGEVAEVLLNKKKVTTLFQEPLTLGDLEESFREMRKRKGKGAASARTDAASALLLRASPLEGKYLVKVLTGEMRTGLVSGLMEEAVARAYGLPKEEVAEAHLLVGDMGLLAKTAASEGLGRVRMTQFRPVNFMLAEPMADALKVAERFGRKVWAEFKYDGVRAQIHKLDGVAKIYSRRLEDVTSSFPEVEAAAAHIDHDFVLDGEIVPFRDGRPLPFQLLQRRLRRIRDFEIAVSQAPVKYFAFDALLLDGAELYRLPLKDRSPKLDALLKGTGLERAERFEGTSADDFQRIFRRSRDLGYEGLVVKDPESSYTMGRRGGGWVKLKEELDTLDVVIVAAEYGHGKRVGLISDYTFAVRTGNGLKTIGKAYSGLTDQEIEMMTVRLMKITVKELGYRRLVKPLVVLEVAFDSIQRSTRHDSGFALRFPRIKRVRDDKSPEDIDTIEKVEEIFHTQKVALDEA